MRYLLFLFLFQYVRIIEGIIMRKVINFSDPLTLMILMFFGEFLGGLAIVIYQQYFISSTKKVNESDTNNKPKIAEKYILLHSVVTINKEKNLFKIYFLIFIAAFFDFNEFIILCIIPNIAMLSPTSDKRLCILTTITSSLLCTFALKIKTGRHHTFSLIGMSICSFIIVIIELVYKSQEIKFDRFLLAYLLVFCELMFVSFFDVIEKYLVEHEDFYIFTILSLEGFYGIILCLIYALSTNDNPINTIDKAYKELDVVGKILLILFMILYFVLSAGLNIYKIICNIVYTPMVKSLAGYFLNPFVIIYYFIYEDDFMSEGSKNYFYFFSNIILSSIINFFACIYNEFFVLNCFSLKKDTHFGITERSHKNVLHELEQFDQENSDNSLSITE